MVRVCLVVLALFAAACGRIGYDGVATGKPADAGARDAPIAVGDSGTMIDAGAGVADGSAGYDVDPLNACQLGYLDCNDAGVDGCEVSPLFDPNNCGACGHVCAQRTMCCDGCCLQVTTCPYPPVC